MTYSRTDLNKAICNNTYKQSIKTYQLVFDIFHSLKHIDYQSMYPASQADDLNNSIDVWINNQPIALRCRELEYMKYQDLTIRYNNNHQKSEYHKCLTGKNKSLYTIYYWSNYISIKKMLVVLTSDIIAYLKHNVIKPISNYDGSSFVAIPIDKLKTKMFLV